jgi:O-methyltransferase
MNKKKNLPRFDELPLDKITNFKSDQYWGVENPERFKELMREMIGMVSPGYFLGDNLFTWARNLSVLEDVPFRNSWENNTKNSSDEAIIWRRYILACAAYHCLHIKGDFVECGMYEGTGVKTVIDYLGGVKFEKTFWGYDLFDQHPVSGEKVEYHGAELYEEVKKRFKDYKQVKLIKGLLPDAFENNEPLDVAYLHIDLNNLEGEISVLERLFDRVTPGGVVILDDYEWSFYRAQKKGEDQWFDERGYRVFPLPTGQGIVIKR